jgi:hypothetical protein
MRDYAKEIRDRMIADAEMDHPTTKYDWSMFWVRLEADPTGKSGAPVIIHNMNEIFDTQVWFITPR